MRRTGMRRTLLALAVSLACLGGLAFSIDLDTARWCKTGHIPREVMRFLNFSEVFGHGLGVATLLLAAVVLDPSLAGRRATPRFGRLPLSPDCARMIAATFAGGILANVVKEVSALATFGNTMATHITSHSDINSFPSGHAATAAGLAAALSWKYPRGVWLFGGLAASVAMQRVASSAHYPSDVLLGAALGLACATIFVGKVPPQSRL